MSTPVASAFDLANQFATQACFHRSLTLESSDKHGPLQVSYAVTSNFEDGNAADLPTVLCMGAMIASRYFVFELDHYCVSNGVKMIFVDRPGFGHSSPVSLAQRVDVWVETVPALLAKLHIDHVAIMSHSAGTIYLLNTLVRLRHILHPTHPYVAMLAPWVHSSQSDVALLSLASKLPEPLITSFGGIQKFVATKIMPATSYSSGILGTLACAFGKSRADDSEDEDRIVAAYGVDKATRDHIEKLQMKHFFAENPTGISDESLVCLKKSGPGMWGVCEDYETYVDDLVRAEMERLADSVSQTQKLRVHVFFAESDFMIGKGGQRYFEQCWRRAGVSQAIDFDSTTVPDTNHDTVVSPKKSAIKMIIDELKSCSRS